MVGVKVDINRKHHQIGKLGKKRYS